jgi:GDP-mannose 6-dehydrogenase
MKIVIFGLGYVGVTAMCCLATEGHTLVGIDVSAAKVDQINHGTSPITEPGIAESLREGLALGRISAAIEIGDTLDDADMAIVCVGTPSAPDGSHNMAYIGEVTAQIARAVKTNRKDKLTVAYRSTIRPGTMEGLIQYIFVNELGDRFFDLIEPVYNPEFLRESSAMKDFFDPPKIVVGTKDGLACARIDELNKNIKAQTFNVQFGEAEITKFVDNTWHAVKVAYANEIGRVCLQLGISAAKVHEIFVSDTKLNISAYYTRPGGPFGGSCLPKDVRALQHIAADCGANTHLVDALVRSNEAHKYRLFQQATENLAPKSHILLVGVAFKEGTDDLRESPNVDLARNLLREGHTLSIFDPAIDEKKLVGANLGYVYTHMPMLAKLLISRSDAETMQFDRVLAANATIKQLKLRDASNIVNLYAMA